MYRDALKQYLIMNKAKKYSDCMFSESNLRVRMTACVTEFNELMPCIEKVTSKSF